MSLQTAKLTYPGAAIALVVTADLECHDATVAELVREAIDGPTASWAFVQLTLLLVQTCLAVELCTTRDLLWVSGNRMAYQTC